MKEVFETLEEARKFCDKQYYDGFLYIVKDNTRTSQTYGKYLVLSHNALHTVFYSKLRNIDIIEEWDCALRPNV